MSTEVDRVRQTKSKERSIRTLFCVAYIYLTKPTRIADSYPDKRGDGWLQHISQILGVLVLFSSTPEDINLTSDTSVQRCGATKG